MQDFLQRNRVNEPGGVLLRKEDLALLAGVRGALLELVEALLQGGLNFRAIMLSPLLVWFVDPVIMSGSDKRVEEIVAALLVGIEIGLVGQGQDLQQQVGSRARVADQKDAARRKTSWSHSSMIGPPGTTLKRLK